MTAPGISSRIPIYPILAVNFVGTLGFGIVLPFLVYLVTRLGGNAMIYGVVGATYSCFQLIGAPILGSWSDRLGRRRILLLSQVGTLASWGIFLVALAMPASPLVEVESSVVGTFTITVPLVVLFVARALDGITGGNVSVANAYLADITPDDERGAAFGKMSVSSNLGYILGPALAGLLGATALGETLPVLAAFAISLVATIMIAAMLPESRLCLLMKEPEAANVSQVLGPDQKQCYTMVAPSRMALKDVLRLRGVARLLIQHFLVFLAFNFFYVAFPVHAAVAVGWSLTETGMFFAVLSLSMVVVQGPILSRASKWFDDRVLLLVGSAVLAVSFAFFASSSTATLYVGAVLLAVGNGLMWPCLLSLLSKASDPDTQGAVQGYAGSSSAIASVLGLLAGGVLYGAVGVSVFLFAAAITAGVLILGLNQQPVPQPATLT